MAVLGIVLIVLAVILGLGVTVSSNQSTTLEVFGVEFGVMVPTVFFVGAAAGAALVFGLWLTKKGVGRGYRRHKEVKDLRHQVEATPSSGSTESPDPSAEPSQASPTGTYHDDGYADTTGPADPPTVADGTQAPPRASHRRPTA